jgi:hypothetical protein
MRILLPSNLTKKTASEKKNESVGRVIFSGSYLLRLMFCLSDIFWQRIT